MLMFLKRISGQPTFNLNACGGHPFGVMELTYSRGMWSDSTESADSLHIISPFIRFKPTSLICEAVSFFAHSIALLLLLSVLRRAV